MALLTFKGGIHPDDGKRLAKDAAQAQEMRIPYLGSHRAL